MAEGPALSLPGRRSVLSGVVGGLGVFALGKAARGQSNGAPHPALLGVYKGAAQKGRAALGEFERLVGRPAECIVDYADERSWNQFASSTRWAFLAWNGIGRRLIFSLPLNMADSSLDQTAGGMRDDLFAAAGYSAVANGHVDCIFRPGWEMNGDWYAWSAAKDPSLFVSAYRRAVDVLRRTPGNNFTFCWCPNSGLQQRAAVDFYPGDEYCDHVGLDAYNSFWDDVTSLADRWEKAVLGYDTVPRPDAIQFGLEWLENFSASHGKPVIIAEWGTGTRVPGGDSKGGGDDPYYISKMAEWIRSHPVTAHAYFDYPSPEYQCRISLTGLGSPDPRDEKPQAAAAFKAAFGQG